MAAALPIGTLVAIKAPFGDGVTPRPIEDAMAINPDGEPAIGPQPVAFWQYLVGDAYFAEQFLEVL